MSYPDRELGMQHTDVKSLVEEGRVTAHTDAASLAAAAELAGIDARFVVLRRDPVDAVMSIMKRLNHSFDSVARIMRDSDVQLSWQLLGA